MGTGAPSVKRRVSPYASASNQPLTLKKAVVWPAKGSSQKRKSSPARMRRACRPIGSLGENQNRVQPERLSTLGEGGSWSGASPPGWGLPDRIVSADSTGARLFFTGV